MKRVSNIITISAVIIMSLVMFSCSHSNKKHRAGNIEILRFEKEIFDIPTNKLQAHLTQIQSTYDSKLLNVLPNDARFMEQLSGFTQDSAMREIYDTVMAHYENLYWLEDELTPAMKRAQQLDPDIHPMKFITFVSGWLDYEHRISADESTVLISIDQYIVPHMKKYGYFGLPMFLVNLCDSAYIATDCMAAVGRSHIVMPEKEVLSMLDYMIAEGKTLYFLDQVMPKKDDHLKIRYTDEQYNWMRQNEGNVSAYFVQNKMLFETNLSKFHNFIDEAPKTNAFKDSAPRTAAYIGWQIVKAYTQKTKCTMKQLFDETDSQKILQSSGYHPKVEKAD